MNITTSLIFIPKDAVYVKKSLGSDILTSSTPQNPLLRDVNFKNKPKETKVEKTSDKPSTKKPEKKSSGNKKYIINKTASPIHITLNERDESGRSIQKAFIIEKYIDKVKFSTDQLDSAELKSLYKNDFIFDGDESDLPHDEDAETSKEILERKYKTRGVKKTDKSYVGLFGDTEKTIKITEDLHENDRSIIESDDDLPEPKFGISEMLTEANEADDGSIDDLIPAYSRAASFSGDKRSIKRA